MGLLPIGLHLLLWSLALLPMGWSAPAPPPNLILIVVDDLGYGDIGPFGSSMNRTPQLDRLAREGLTLTSFYAAPVCTPSRAQILTGSYAKRVSLPHVLRPASAIGLSRDEPTIASVLKPLGYATIAIGKWHVGDHPEFLPTAHGFDSYFGLPYSNDMGHDPRSQRHRSSPPLPLVGDRTVLETVTPEGQNRLTERYTEKAVSFIKEHQHTPFLLYLPHTAVHTPLHPGDAFRGTSGNGLFGDWVQEVDHSVGRIVETLRELELETRTLVVFTSDNGPWLTKGKDGGESGPLRGGKGGTYEGGVRVPFLAWWPGTIPAGRTSSAIAANFDLLPTFAALAGAPLPQHHRIDGKDLTPLLLGKSDQSPRNEHLYFSGNQLQAIRSGPWKLALVRQNEANGKPHPDHGKPFTPALYHLEKDPGETTDLAPQHPDRVAALQALAAEVEADLGTDAPGPGVRPPGRVQRPTGLWLPGQAPSAAEIEAHYDAKPIGSLSLGESLPSRQAPFIANRPFSLKLEVSPARPEGILLAQGGSAYGYALHLRDRQLFFTVREAGKPVAIHAAVPANATFEITASLTRQGELKLSIDQQVVAAGRAPGLISRQPAEDFSLGHDNGAPVAEYQNAGPFAGTLRRLEITFD